MRFISSNVNMVKKWVTREGIGPCEKGSDIV